MIEGITKTTITCLTVLIVLFYSEPDLHCALIEFLTGVK